MTGDPLDVLYERHDTRAGVEVQIQGGTGFPFLLHIWDDRDLHPGYSLGATQFIIPRETLLPAAPPQRVWLLVPYVKWEGNGEPEMAFASKEAAEAYADAHNPGDPLASWEVVELDVRTA